MYGNWGRFFLGEPTEEQWRLDERAALVAMWDRPIDAKEPAKGLQRVFDFHFHQALKGSAEDQRACKLIAKSTLQEALNPEPRPDPHKCGSSCASDGVSLIHTETHIPSKVAGHHCTDMCSGGTHYHRYTKEDGA